MYELPVAFPGLEPPPGPVGRDGAGGGRASRTETVLKVLVVLTLLAGVLIYVLGNGRNAAAAVSEAVATSTAGRTAHMAVHGTVTVAGTSVSTSGSGGVDFGNDASQLTVGTTVAGHQITETVDYVAGTAYIGLPQIAELAPGKQWVSVDLSSVAGAGATNGLSGGTNPAGWLPLLAAQGDQVTSIGSSTIDGTTVQGYAVVVSPANVESQLSSSSIPSWMRAMLKNVSVGSYNFKVYVDNDNLLRRITVSTQESIHSSATMQINESITFSDYGAPVDVTAPTPGTVVTFQTFVKSVGSAASGSPT